MRPDSYVASQDSDRHDYDVFICHHRRDSAELARSLHEHLIGCGLRVFCDLVDDPELALVEKIFDKIRASATFLFVGSAGAMNALTVLDSWPRRELECARMSGCRIAMVQVGSPSGYPAGAPLADTGIADCCQLVLHDARLSKIGLRSVHESLMSAPLDVASAIERLKITQAEFEELLNGVYAATRFDDQVIDFATFHDKLSRTKSKADGPITGQSLLNMASTLGPKPLRAILRRVIAVAVLRDLAREANHVARLRSTDVRPLWPLLYSTIDENSGLDPLFAVSSQGFYSSPLLSIIQGGRIRELLRLHVWPTAESLIEANQQAKSSVLATCSPLDGNPFAIHSHQSHATSWLLAGELHNHAYEVQETPWPNSPLATFVVRWDNAKAYNLRHKQSYLQNTGTGVSARADCSTIFKPGQSYTVQAGEYHATDAHAGSLPFSATLFYFDASQGFIEDAPVLGPRSTEKSVPHEKRSVDAGQYLHKLNSHLTRSTTRAVTF